MVLGLDLLKELKLKKRNTENLLGIIDDVEYLRSVLPENAKTRLEAAKNYCLEKDFFGKCKIIERIKYNNYLLNGRYSF